MRRPDRRVVAGDLARRGVLYAPYDGGADVYPGTLEHRARLRTAHADWLPSTESGL